MTADKPRTKRLAWVDLLRVVGAMMIFVFHFSGDYGRIAGPLASLSAPLAAYGSVRDYVDDWAIAIFVVLSGLSLSLALESRGQHVSRIKRHYLRLLKPVWIVAVPFTIAGVIVGEMVVSDFWKVPIWFSGLGVVSPATFFPVAGSWWYVSLAVQCALLMPLVVRLARRITLPGTIACLLAVDFATLGLIGLLPAEWGYLARGLAIARLIELGFGFVAAEVITRRSTRRQALMAVVLLGGGAIVANALGAYAWLPAVLGVGGIVAALAFATRADSRSSPRLASAGQLTYPFYLVHAPIGKYLLVVGTAIGFDSFYALLALSLIVSVFAASSVQWIQCQLERQWSRRHERHTESTAADATIAPPGVVVAGATEEQAS